MKTESTSLAKERETKYCEEKERRNRRWIFFQLSFFSSNTCLLAGSVLTYSPLGVRPLFKAHPKMGATTFGRIYIVLSGVQLSVFTSSHQAAGWVYLFSIVRPLLTAFPFESPSTTLKSLPIFCKYVSIFYPSGRCFTNLDFPICFSRFIYVPFFAQYISPGNNSKSTCIRN